MPGLPGIFYYGFGVEVGIRVEVGVGDIAGIFASFVGVGSTGRKFETIGKKVTLQGCVPTFI